MGIRPRPRPEATRSGSVPPGTGIRPRSVPPGTGIGYFFAEIAEINFVILCDLCLSRTVIAGPAPRYPSVCPTKRSPVQRGTGAYIPLAPSRPGSGIAPSRQSGVGRICPTKPSPVQWGTGVDNYFLSKLMIPIRSTMCRPDLVPMESGYQGIYLSI